MLKHIRKLSSNTFNTYSHTLNDINKSLTIIPDV